MAYKKTLLQRMWQSLVASAKICFITIKAESEVKPVIMANVQMNKVKHEGKAARFGSDPGFYTFM